ncbi:MAG: hypothetical protein H0T76_13445 [Nannocystis sp.]|nr:putative Ig domain-containing protein [Nannocystis sp.]MBA3547486.1 hypothetical protein [Nannocystis sp.]
MAIRNSWVIIAPLCLSACGGGDSGSAGVTEGSTGTSAAASTGTSATSEPTGAASLATTDEATAGGESLSGTSTGSTGPTGTDGDDATATVAETATTGTTTAVADTTDGSTAGTTGAVNLAPEITSKPVSKLQLEQKLGGKFKPGQIFLASSVTKEIRVYDKATLKFVQSFSHPLFAETIYNPRGMAFNERANLVVATFTTFIEFSDYGIVYKTYPKKDPEATENVIFDALGNLYTTTATGGTDHLNQYAALDYAFAQTIKGPVGAGQYTGITFDDKHRLYLASQSDNKIHVAEADGDFKTFMWTKALPGQGPAVRLEGLVFNRTGELLVAQADLLRYDLGQGKVVGTFDVPQDVWPVPVSVDNDGNIYTADFEDGNGSKSADIVRFDPQGENPLTFNDPLLQGPFGLAISGTVLASDPPVLYSYQVTATDPEGDVLTFTLQVAPPGMTIDAQSGLIEWFVTSKQLGAHDVTVEVADGQGNTDVQMFALEIATG